MATAADKKARIGVLGASGYTGAELVRLLIRHPRAELALLTADRRAGRRCARCFRSSRRWLCPGCSRSRTWTGPAPASISSSAPCPMPPPRRSSSTSSGPACDQDRRPLGRLPARRPGRLRALVRARASRARAAAAGGVRPGRDLSREDQARAARRQSRLLHHLRPARAHSAAASQDHRSRRRS